VTVEHRCARRYALALPVRLYSSALGELRGLARDLGSGGVFVAIEGTAFAPWSVLEVELPLPARRGSRKVRRAAIVVHRQPDGVGLMFDEVLPRDLVARLAALRAPSRIVAEAANPPAPQLQA